MSLVVAKGLCSAQGMAATVTGARASGTVVVLQGGRAVVRTP